ncbi:putative bacteriocin [Streptococcus pneumoniae]|nr:putative bacteriocin [Streptococcus pneumoniae]
MKHFFAGIGEINFVSYLLYPKFQVEVSHPKEIHLATCSPSIF